MDILTVDGECYYDNDYTLTKMTTEAYVRDPRFEPHLWGFKWNDGPSQWVLPDRWRQFVKEEVDWSNTALIAHHAHFDGFWLSHHDDVQPAFWLDTLSMARVVDGPKAANDLRSLCIRHGIGYKGDFITYAKGRHLADFSRDQLMQYGEYCCNDVDRTYDLAQIFMPQIPGFMLQLQDLKIRMFTEPALVGDTALLREAVTIERKRKVELLQRIGLTCERCKGTGHEPQLSLSTPEQCGECLGTGVDKKPIGSSEQFANLLRAQGVEPQTKRSNTSGEQIYAFAKTDSAMQALVEDEDDAVRFLAEARLGVKSNIIETRAKRFLQCAENGLMPVYIKPNGTHTHRSSAGDRMNWQNMTSVNKLRPEMTVLKRSIQAPPGCKIVAVDSSQIQARLVSWVSGQHDAVEAFAQNRDVYSEFATVIYNRPIDRRRNKGDFIEGQVGKISELGFRFGQGWYMAAFNFLKGHLGAPPIQFKLADMEVMGVDPNPFLANPRKVAQVNEMPSRLELNDRLIHCLVTEYIVKRWRSRNPQNVAFWDTMERVINAMIRGIDLPFGPSGFLHTEHEAIILPSGMRLRYRGLTRDEDGQATYFNGRTREHIYGGSTTNNLAQVLEQEIIGPQMLTVHAAGYKVAVENYDSIVCVVPDEYAQQCLDFMFKTMKQTDAWATGLPLMAEGGIGQTYAEAK